MMKEKAIKKIDRFNELLAKSPVGKGLLDGGLSLIPFFGAAASSTLSTRAAGLAYQNTKRLVEELRKKIASMDEKKLDTSFIESDEFTALLLKTIEVNARAYRQEKTALYAKIFVGFLRPNTSKTPYKEGLIQIIDALSPEHIRALAVIYGSGEPPVTANRIASELGIEKPRALAYCEQMIRFGLVRDWSIGKFDYTPGNFEITEYGRELCALLEDTV